MKLLFEFLILKKIFYSYFFGTISLFPINLRFFITEILFAYYVLSILSAILKRPRTPPNNAAVDYQTADSEHALKRSRPFGMSDEVVRNYSFVFPTDLVEVLT